jgi:hypothetical protein
MARAPLGPARLLAIGTLALALAAPAASAKESSSSGKGESSTSSTAATAAASAEAKAEVRATANAANGMRLSQALFVLDASYTAGPSAPPRAAGDDRLRQMADYDQTMLSALGLPDGTPDQHAARNNAIADARLQLATATDRQLNPLAVEQIDAALGLPATDPLLGVR